MEAAVAITPKHSGVGPGGRGVINGLVRGPRGDVGGGCPTSAPILWPTRPWGSKGDLGSNLRVMGGVLLSRNLGKASPA